LFEYFIDYTYIINLRFFSNEEKLYEEKGFDMPETIFYISEYIFERLDFEKSIFAGGGIFFCRFSQSPKLILFMMNLKSLFIIIGEKDAFFPGGSRD